MGFELGAALFLAYLNDVTQPQMQGGLNLFSAHHTTDKDWWAGMKQPAHPIILCPLNIRFLF